MSRLVALGAVLAAGVAAAEDSVAAKAMVVFASTAPGAVDPELAAMRDTLAERVAYRTLKKLSATELTLSKAPRTVKLPNGKVAELTLLGIKDNVAQVKVKLPPLDTTYSLAKKSLYVQGGSHEGGDLWLVLSPPG